MHGTVTVRPATERDDVPFADLIRDADLPLAGLASTRIRFIAEVDGVVRGVAALEEHADEHGAAILLRSVAVRPEGRGQGTGAALTRAALRFVDERGLPVALLTETAADWFPRFGFTEVPRDDLPTALAASEELQGACTISARSFIRAPRAHLTTGARRG